MDSWNARCYLSADDLSEIDKRFAIALKEDECMVFWTGVSRTLAQQWAQERGLKTLAIAMGPLMDPLNPTSPQHRMNRKNWSKYMKGASGRYAQYACRNRRAIVITNPPPNIYSTREHSTYRHLEEPILKGVSSGEKVISISYVHPSVYKAVNFSYQVWPSDQSFRWTEFVQKMTTTISNVVSMLGTRAGDGLSNISEPCQFKTKTLAAYVSAESDLEQKAVNQNQKDVLQWEALQKKEVKQQRVLAEKQAALQKREAKKQRALVEQQAALQKKKVKQQRVLAEKQAALQKKEANKQRALAEQQAALQKREAKRQRALAEKQAALEKREAKRQRALAEKQAALQKKEAK